jgi:hypothetical protein
MNDRNTILVLLIGAVLLEALLLVRGGLSCGSRSGGFVSAQSPLEMMRNPSSHTTSLKPGRSRAGCASRVTRRREIAHGPVPGQ